MRMYLHILYEYLLYIFKYCVYWICYGRLKEMEKHEGWEERGEGDEETERRMRRREKRKMMSTGRRRGKETVEVEDNGDNYQEEGEKRV